MQNYLNVSSNLHLFSVIAKVCLRHGGNLCVYYECVSQMYTAMASLIGGLRQDIFVKIETESYFGELTSDMHFRFFGA